MSTVKKYAKKYNTSTKVARLVNKKYKKGVRRISKGKPVGKEKKYSIGGKKVYTNK